MNVAVVTSVSTNVADFAEATIPNKLSYCLRHGYSLIADNEIYEVAVARTDRLCAYLDRFDFLWALDADAVITNMDVRIESLPCLGPHVTVCEEGIVPWNRVNCGSMVWRNTFQSRWLANTITALRPAWLGLACQWQTWLGNTAETLGEVVTVAPVGAFNSCEWTHPGGQSESPGTHWKPGDLVYHACGVFPREEKLRRVRAMSNGTDERMTARTST
jgi:hypothetical protein